MLELDFAENVDIDPDDIKSLKKFALDNKIDLTVVGPEKPLVDGIVDEFKKDGLLIFGPNKKAAQLEGSKAFSKEFMLKYDIPTAKYKEFNDYHKAVEGIKDFSYPLVIKADGLCAGKGVIICNSPVEALYALKDILVEKKFKDQGEKLIVEEFLEGYEASVFLIASNNKLHFFSTAKDYKKIGTGDKGLNTGGVGCFSPNLLLDNKTRDEILAKIVPKLETGLEKEGMDFSGILFVGFMITKDGPKVLEFNVRFGDPETEVMLPRLKSDLFDLLYKASSDKESIKEEDIVFSEKITMTVILTSGGYPESYKKGYEISGTKEFLKSDKDLYLVHNGTKIVSDKLYTNGGRVLSCSAMKDTMSEAREAIYSNISKIHFNDVYYRDDIGNDICKK